MTRPRDAAAVAALLALTLGLAACGGGDGSGSAGGGGQVRKIDWDLSRSHTVKDVDFEPPDVTATELKPVESVRITLPGGKVFSANGGVVHDVSLERDGERLTTVQIDSQPQSADDAYKLAVEWAKAWGVPTKALDAWHAAGDPKQKAEAFPKAGGRPPLPTVQIRYSFQDQRPSLASLQFSWPAGG
jgi:hypothetical protein